MIHDVVQIANSKKRFKVAYRELIGAGVVGAAYFMGGAAAVESATRAIDIGPQTVSQQNSNQSCVTAALMIAMTIAKEVPIQKSSKSQK